jgi:hypothetical protein
VSRSLRVALAVATASVSLFVAAAPAHAVPREFYGVVTQGGLEPADFELMAGADVGLLRFMLNWPVVQESAGDCQADAQVGTCDWRTYDAVIGRAAARGIEVLPYLLNVPPFIADDQDTPPVRTSAAREAWTDFVTALAQRYGPGGAYWTMQYPLDHPGAVPLPVESWQVWNEPSASPFWYPKPKPREYGELVKLTSEAITGVDANARIILAGIFGTPIVENGGIKLPEFLRKLYKTPKIERYFDAVAIHPYGPDLKRVRFQVDRALDEMRRAGDRRAGLWITEIGWASDRLHNQLGVGPKGQAKMLTRMYRMFRRKRNDWNIGAVTWYGWQDTDDENYCDFCRRSGLVTVNREPKLSYDAFREQAGR